jgi:dTDP-D-glucose 4,6-dehydratase
MSRAKSYGYKAEISIVEGINNTIDWYVNNKNIIKKNYGILK